ncbi:mannan endo-1,4-beta-mannosidase [Anoxybacillus tepidamans]|uniref:Mannan endo-1,4-beta-mannosidase n=1 Tax=Anoxybacteroides tepidamans TaxID=265948 RepID=A0A7W8ITM9_9BACL|nr:glycosyl hydrolase [Anoxybacillus tepidamans]MBB5325711.1 mannan endo-1,4-beta-mannosidase [Anoxybacillus tepidamans]
MKIGKWLVFFMSSTIVLSTISAYAQTSVTSSVSLSTVSQAKKQKNPSKPNSKRVENLVDPLATDDTKSLFAYLKDVRGKQVLFGHQHAIDEGLTLIGSKELESEVKNSVGDFPAVFGWDTLSLEGKEKPGVPNDPKQSRANLVASMKKVHKLGGIIALSAHMPNFVTGGSFNDTTGNVVEHILPGGDKNAEFNSFLDNIAQFAKELKDDKGKQIPILFRPFHEQNGSWFWWGAKTTTPSQYIEIYRYTVEYLRDKKGVHNFLYVYSPNGTFGGSEANYLTTYPGDDYVDILGMDQYDNQSNPGTTQFLTNLVKDLEMISKLADTKGKIAAFSEFGYSPQGMKTTGNGDLKWFTKVLNAIKADRNAKRIAYMQTWANFGLNGNLFVPYNDAPNGLGDHELLPDFINYYKDPYTAFLREVKGVYNNKVEAAKEQPFMHIASPTDNATVKTATTKIRVRVLNQKPSKVVYVVEGSSKEVPMKLDADGYYSANWSPVSKFNGKSVKITVKSYMPNKTVMKQTVNVFVKVPEILIKQFTFDRDIKGIRNIGTWPDTIKTNFEHARLNGNGKLKINITGMVRTDTWQEIKLELSNIKDIVPLSNVNRVKFDVLVPVSAGQQNANASLRGIIMLPPDWNEKYGMTTTEKALANLQTVTINRVKYAEFPVMIDLNDPAKLSAAKGLVLSIVGNGLELNGAVYVDNIKLFSTYTETPTDPALVDDFESYQGSNAVLQQKFVKAGGDTITVSLDGSHKSSGTYAMKVDYTLAGSGYAGVTKSLGGVDWSRFNKLKFWLTPDGKDQKLVIQLRVDGVYYEAYPSLASTTPGWVELHFNDFTVAPWDTANLGKKLNKISLKNVQDFAIYVNSKNGTTLSSTLYFDDIKAIYDATAASVPNGGTGPGSTPEQPGTLYDFETGVQGWEVEQNQANATTPTITTDAAAKGTHSLTSTFDLTKTGGFELTKVQVVDLSAVKTISAKVKISTGTANARLYIKTGSNWQWHDSGMVAVDSSEFKTLTISLNPAWGIDNVKSIGVKIEPTSGTGNASVYVDDVALSE